MQNPLIRQLILLQSKSRERRKSGLFVLEGRREITLALKGGYRLKTLFFCSEIIGEDAFISLKRSILPEVEIIEISSELYSRLAYRGSTEGVIAVCFSKDLSLDNLKITSSVPLLLIAEAPEKPGNIGALLRTADAAGLDAVIIANPRTDFYNPNLIRSSLGCLFTVPIASGSTAEIISYLKNQKINYFCAALQASVPYYRADFTRPAAIVVGTEATGLSREWLDGSKQNIIIPMQGKIDSMNLSVAAGILIFEAKRQRGF